MGKRRDLPIFTRGGYWYCHVITAAGKRRQRALHIRNDGSKESERIAIAAYWQEQARATNGTLDQPVRARITLGEAIKALSKQQVLAQLSDHRHRSVFFASKHLYTHFGTGFDVTTITKTMDYVDYATWRRTAVPEKKIKARLPITVRKELMVLAQAMRAVGLNPPPLPKLGDVSPKPQQPLNAEELKRFMLALKPRHKFIGLSFACLGFRASEYNKVTEVDWDRQMLYVAGTKTKRSKRWVPIPDELFEVMMAMRDRGEWKGFGGVSERQIDNIIRKTCEHAKIGPRSSNDIRGTYSTNLALQGVSAAERAALQGNSELQQQQTYAQPHLRPEELRDAAAKLPRIHRRSAGASHRAAIEASTAGGEGPERAK